MPPAQPRRSPPELRWAGALLLLVVLACEEATPAEPPAVTTVHRMRPDLTGRPVLIDPLDCAAYERRGLPDRSRDEAEGEHLPNHDPSAEEGGLSAGPVVGATTANATTIWVRGADPGSWQVRHWPAGDPSHAVVTRGPTLEEERDLTGALRITGLAPATSYEYAVERSGVQVGSGTFRTFVADGQPATLRVLIGADIDSTPSQPIFARMAEQRADLLLLIGDFIYADLVPESVPGYTAMYRQPLTIPQLAALLSNTSTFMIWDDHDILDNFWPGKTSRFEPAKRAYELYVQPHNPASLDASSFDYRFRFGDIAFYVLDTRSRRSANNVPDSPGKSMLGRTQKNELFAWLACERATLKVIVSSVVFSRFANTGLDSWNGFASERDELFDFIHEQRIDDVLILSGDQHWSAVFRYQHRDATFYEFLPTPLSKARGFAPVEATDEILARDDDMFVYGAVDIDTQVQPATIALTLCADDRPCEPGQEPAPTTGLDMEGASENVPFTVQLTTDELGFRPASRAAQGAQ